MSSNNPPRPDLPPPGGLVFAGPEFVLEAVELGGSSGEFMQPEGFIPSPFTVGKTSLPHSFFNHAGVSYRDSASLRAVVCASSGQFRRSTLGVVWPFQDWALNDPVTADLPPVHPCVAGILFPGDLPGGIQHFLWDFPHPDIVREASRKFHEIRLGQPSGAFLLLVGRIRPTFPIDSVDASLVQQTPAGAPLRRARQLRSTGDNIIAHVAGKAGPGRLLRLITRDCGLDASRDQPSRDLFVDQSIRLQRAMP